MIYLFDRCDSGLTYLISLYPSPKDSPTHDDILVQKETIKNSFKILPYKDEVLKHDVDISPKMCLSHESILEEEDDIVNTFLNVTLPSIHGTSLREKMLDGH